MVILLAHYYSGDKTEKNEIGWSCSTYGERRNVDRLWWGNPRERDLLEYPGLDRMILLSWIFSNLGGGTWTVSRWPRVGRGGDLLRVSGIS